MEIRSLPQYLVRQLQQRVCHGGPEEKSQRGETSLALSERIDRVTTNPHNCCVPVRSKHGGPFPC